jgi:hypothetical protein
LLVFAHPSSETDEMLADLERRPDLCVLRVASIAGARFALEEVPVDLVLVCPTTDKAAFSAVLETARELRPRTPVLVVSSEPAPPPTEERSATLGLLRAPVLPDVLNRTVDVALGLRASAGD